MVIGNDLRNEVRVSFSDLFIPLWNFGGAHFDWKRAATLAAEAILAVNPNHLIIVESPNSGLNMVPVKPFPMKLSVPNRLIYSVHLYGFQSWSGVDMNHDYDTFKSDMER